MIGRDLQTYAINNTAGWILNFTKIFSLDWTNVTITESQISDLVHTVNGTNIDVLNVNSSSIDNWGNLTMHGNNITNLSYINPDGEELFLGGNMTLTDRISFAFGQAIDNLVTGWLRITGNLQVDGDLNMTGNFTGNQIYGEMWMQNETGEITTAIGTQDIYYNITGFNATDWATGQSLNGFAYDNAAEHLTALVAGKYKIDYSISAGNAGNNEEYHFVVAINNVLQNQTVSHRKIATAGDVGNSGGTGFLDLLVGDNVHMMVADHGGTADLEVHSMNLNLMRIGE